MTGQPNPTSQYASLSDDALRDLALHNPPSDPTAKAALAAELRRRADARRGARATTGQQVVVTDIDMPFGSMVTFMVKWAIASIPAFVILFVLFAVVAALVGGLGRALIQH